MNTLPPEIKTALAAKQKHRRELAALPYEEKLRILLRLQRISDAIRQTRGAPARAWPLDDKTLLPMSSVPPSILDSITEDASSPAGERHHNTRGPSTPLSN